MSVHELRKVKVTKAQEFVKNLPACEIRLPGSEQFDDDLRRLVISMAAVIKRRYPNDYQRMMAEADAHIANLEAA